MAHIFQIFPNHNFSIPFFSFLFHSVDVVDVVVFVVFVPFVLFCWDLEEQRGKQKHGKFNSVSRINGCQ